MHRVTNSSLVETLDNVLRGDIVLVNDTEDNLIAIVDLPAGTYDTAAAEYVGYEKVGGINIIDLANIDSCSFIATDDLGKKLKKGGFEILGRLDNSDLRGCNLLTR